MYEYALIHLYNYEYKCTARLSNLRSKKLRMFARKIRKLHLSGGGIVEPPCSYG